MSRVRNTKSDDRWSKPKDGKHNSWIDYWNGYCIEQEPETCPCCGGKMSDNGGAVGGHVRKVDEPHGDVYVTPICDLCNKKFKESKTYDVEFEVSDNLLIHANFTKLKDSEEYLDPTMLKLAGLTFNDLKKK